MICVSSEGKYLAPLTICDVCHYQIKGPGYAWTLTPADGEPRTREAYFSHKHCAASFEAQNPEPPGWRWSKVDIHEFLSLLADNTKTKAEKVPVKGSNLQ